MLLDRFLNPPHCFELIKHNMLIVAQCNHFESLVNTTLFYDKKRFDLPFSFPLINDLIHESIKFRPDYYFPKFLNGEFPKETLSSQHMWCFARFGTICTNTHRGALL